MKRRTRDEEEEIQYHYSSALNNPEHPIRKAIEGRIAEAGYDAEEVDPEASEQFSQEVIEGAQDAPSAEGGDE